MGGNYHTPKKANRGVFLREKERIADV